MTCSRSLHCPNIELLFPLWYITKVSRARLQFSLALAVVAFKVWNTAYGVMYHNMEWRVERDSFTGNDQFGEWGEGGGGKVSHEPWMSLGAGGLM